MEQKDFQNSQLDGCWYANMPPPNQFNVVQSSNSAKWSFEENKVFDNALAEQVEVVESQAFLQNSAIFENLAIMISYKSMHDIKIHLEELVKDIEMIESDLFPIPEYKTREDTRSLIAELVEETNDKNGKRSSSIKTKRASSSHRRKWQPWTEEEHRLFLMGLDEFGKGNWRSISNYYVTSKTPTQIASHAQKYFRRQTSTTPMHRRRPSIHDIQTVTNVTYPETYMSQTTFTTNLSTTPAPAHTSFQRTTSFINNSMTEVSTNLEENPAMFVLDGHVNSGPHMPSTFMSYQQWG